MSGLTDNDLRNSPDILERCPKCKVIVPKMRTFKHKGVMICDNCYPKSPDCGENRW